MTMTTHAHEAWTNKGVTSPRAIEFRIISQKPMNWRGGFVYCHICLPKQTLENLSFPSDNVVVIAGQNYCDNWQTVLKYTKEPPQVRD